MRRVLRVLPLLLVSLVLIALAVSASLIPSRSAALAAQAQVVKSPNSPTSGELVENPKEWDGKELAFTGEVITEAMERGANSWIHINDDAYYLKNVEEGAPLGGYNSGHAVWIPTELTRKIEHYGDYKNEGDVVTVRGTFNAACGEHGGDMDIHATSLDVDIVGRDVREPVKPLKAMVGLIMALIAAALWVAIRRVEHRELTGLFGGR